MGTRMLAAQRRLTRRHMATRALVLRPPLSPVLTLQPHSNVPFVNRRISPNQFCNNINRNVDTENSQIQKEQHRETREKKTNEETQQKKKPHQRNKDEHLFWRNTLSH